ncbi:DUF4339 domain-containing protein [Polystyrenella longa]|nr:DUF4339 domain-containing protein [Polystyrenella longa]
MAEWFVKRDERIVGPLSTEKLKSYAEKGKLRPEDLIGKSKRGPFREAGRLKALFPEEIDSDDFENEEQDFGFPALKNIDVNAGERVFESYGAERAFDENVYDDDDDDYYRSGRRRRPRGSRQKNVDSTINAAATMLIVYSFCGVLLMIVNLAMLLMGKEAANPFGEMNEVVVPDWVYIAQGFSGLILAGISILAGVCMKQRRGWGFVVTMAVVNMLPLINCCCMTGIPVGMWVLIVMLMGDVKKEF